MPFTSSDRALLQETKNELAGLRTDLGLHAKLVELLAEVKALRGENAENLRADALAIAAELGQSTDEQAAAIQTNTPKT